TGSSGLPGDRNGPGRSCPLLGLAPGGVCRASRSPGCWCALTLRAEAPHHFTLTPSRGKGDRSEGLADCLSLTPGPYPLLRAVSFCCTIPPVYGSCRGTNRFRGWALPTTAPCGARTFLLE